MADNAPANPGPVDNDIFVVDHDYNNFNDLIKGVEILFREIWINLSKKI